jgi:hypothetical protein
MILLGDDEVDVAAMLCQSSTNTTMPIAASTSNRRIDTRVAVVSVVLLDVPRLLDAVDWRLWLISNGRRCCGADRAQQQAREREKEVMKEGRN